MIYHLYNMRIQQSLCPKSIFKAKEPELSAHYHVASTFIGTGHCYLSHVF